MSKKLNILFICGWYPSRVLPTNGDFIQRHAEAVSLKHNVTVFHIITDKNNNQNIESSSKKINGIQTHIKYLKHTKNPVLKIYLFLKAFFSFIKQNDSFHIVHLNELYPFGIFCLYLKWVKKIPFIITEHFTGYHKPQSENISFFQKFISSIIVKKASFICPVSNDLKESMQSLGFSGNYVRVPNVVNTKLFYPQEKNSSIFTITHVSNMVNKHKNIEGIINVIKKLEGKIDNFKFKLIGENSEIYIKYAKKINLNLKNVSFINQIPHKEIPHHLNQSSVFILFSNYENLPCVILESFSCGTPVISTNVGGIGEFFPDDFGYLISPKNEIELVDRILKLYSNYKVDKEKMHLYVENNFSNDSIANQFSELYFKSL